MAGIYIHVPFCKQACHYCNFHFSTNLALQNDFTAALLKEIELRLSYFNGETVETIYFGGGTPSLLPVFVHPEYSGNYLPKFQNQSAIRKLRWSPIRMICSLICYRNGKNRESTA